MRVQLTDEQRATLTAWTRKSSGELRLARRANIVLALQRGLGISAVAALLDLDRNTVRLWRDRFLAGGIEALVKDRPRPGRPRVVRRDVVEAVVTLTRMTLPEDGTHWSVRTMAKVAGASPATVQRIWATNGLKPHLVRTFKLSKDPHFESKLVDVVGLYMDPPENALVLCVDEKSQIQALDRTQPGLPMKKGRCGTMTHDYRRNGTTALFAALEVATGQIISSCKPRHRHQEFLSFLRQIERQTPKGLELHLVLDNYGTHKHPKVRAWLEEHERFHLHFVPTSCSWLNLVERFFALITTRRIRRGSFDSVASLERAIKGFITVHNHEPKPFQWAASAKKILEKVNRCREIYETLH